MSDALRLENVIRTFRQAGEELQILRGVDLAVKSGEIVALLGPSGSGKSTLLHTAGLLEAADGGRVVVGGEDCSQLGDHGRTLIRRRRIGFVYQYHHLLPEFSAVENAAMPLMIQGIARGKAKAEATRVLEGLGLGHRLTHRPARLSGGEQQRVAIARAVIAKPQLLLADEPTGNLDERTAEAAFQALLALVRETGIGALIATHNLALAQRMDRIVTLHEGRLHAA
ncbi:ABC transporter ATP-binding protein [Ferrovibrio sp. MS7]|jgi:lipoprotein-releasing system ATP-binding protein|uniref:ABC transporter ATP-binding protein n=1 Tax=Ferrovibrio plantarum TaxID=3119164 RepID=UPI001B62D16A|nr:ABC transporter ATP-binding protein [Ferrovibrio sp.]